MHVGRLLYRRNVARLNIGIVDKFFMWEEYTMEDDYSLCTILKFLSMMGSGPMVENIDLKISISIHRNKKKKEHELLAIL